MERRDKIIITLLARIAGHLEGIPADEILSAVMDATAPTEKNETPKADPEVVERLYKLYPTKCPIAGRSLGKSAKNKKQIEKLLESRTPQEIETTIREYIVDCKNHNTYLKNFATFLNQFPEKETPPPPARTIAPPPEKKSPELLAIEAMHNGQSAEIARRAIMMIHDGIDEARIRSALYNAGYEQ